MSDQTLATSHSNARIAALYAQGLVDYLQARGFRDRPGLIGASFSGTDAASGETSLAAWIALLEFATRELGEPELPALAGASLQPRHLGALGQVLMSCVDLEEAYRQLARYIRLLGQIGQPEMHIEGAQARLLWRWPYASPAPQSVALFMLAARVRFMRWLCDRPDLMVDASFHGRAPGSLVPFESIFGGTVKFGQPQNCLVFPAAYLRLRVVMADEAFRRQAEERAQSQLRHLTEHPLLDQEVRRILAARLSSGHVTLRDTASLLNLSARTLQRRLSALQVSHQNLLDQVRADCAATLIRDAKVPLAEIAFLLGYSDQSTFQSAYRRWFDASPGRTRRLLGES